MFYCLLAWGVSSSLTCLFIFISDVYYYPFSILLFSCWFMSIFFQDVVCFLCLQCLPLYQILVLIWDNKTISFSEFYFSFKGPFCQYTRMHLPVLLAFKNFIVFPHMQISNLTGFFSAYGIRKWYILLLQYGKPIFLGLFIESTWILEPLLSYFRPS